MGGTLRDKVESRNARLDLEVSSFTGHWKELSDFILTRRGRFLTTDNNRGNKRNSNIIDNTATLASRTLVSGLVSGDTNPARPWFRLATHDPELMEFGPVKQWLQDVERLLRHTFNQSNFYNVTPTIYGELGTFATGFSLIQEDFLDGIRLYPYTVGEYKLSADDRGVVDTVYRESPWTVNQLVQKFGLDTLSTAARNQWDKGNIDEWINVLHVIEPNDERVPTLKDAKNKPWRSAYFEEGGNKDDALGISGYDEFPGMAPRWHTNSGDIYGTQCPGMDALGDIKQLQMEQKRKGQAIDKMTNPPLRAPSTLKGKRISSLPGDVTYQDVQQGMNGVEPLYLLNFPLNELKEDIFDVRDRINSAYYADLFLMLAGDSRRQPATATEIVERHEEKLQVLGPVVTKFHKEINDKAIDRTFNILLKRGMIPPPPEEIQGQNLKVNYISILAQAQQLVGMGGIRELMGIAGNAADLNPSVLDKIDFDQVIDESADMLGVPTKIVRSDDEVEEIRQNRAQAAQAQQQKEDALMAAQGAETLSNADTGGDNALTALAGLQ
jgi:hypothetical protein